MSSAFPIHAGRERSWIAGFLQAAARAFGVAVEGISYGRRMHDAYLKLSAMSDPELQDMGIRRSDISAVVAGSCPLPSRQRVILPKSIPGRSRSSSKHDKSRRRRR